MRYSKVLLPLAIISSLCSFAFAEVDTSSTQSLKKAKNCISGSYKLGNGDGYKGYCCKTQADCLDDCVNGLCTGESAPNSSKTKTSTKTKTKTNGPAPTSCTSGSYGKQNGDGFKGYCCKTQADCQDDCIKGVCNGDSAPNSSKTKTKTSTKTKTNGPSSTCVSGSYGKQNGDGFKGYCCKTQADCQDDCIKGVCNGESAPNSSKTKTKTSTKTKTNGPAPTSCISGSYGKQNGDGFKGYCCKTQADCQDDCIKGVCNGEDAPNSSKTKTKTSTKTKTNGPAPTCVAGSYGKKNGDGYKGYCCKTQADCQDDCIKGVCNGESAPNSSKTKTKTSTKTKTNGPAPTSCTSGSYGKQNGDGFKGYCCKTQADCQDDCIKGVCNGEDAPNSSKPSSCISGYRGKGRGNGPKNACCSSQADCVEDCVKSKCT